MAFIGLVFDGYNYNVTNQIYNFNGVAYRE